MNTGALRARNTLLISTSVILVVGILAVGSASSFYSMLETGSHTTYLRDHLVRVAIGLAAAFIASRAPLALIRKAALPIYILSFLAVVATLVLAETRFAPEINGSVRWLNLGIRVLPADFLRFGFVLLAALLISRTTVDIRSFPGVLLIASLALVPSIFTMLQPDLSGTAFTVMVMMAVLFVGGARFSHILLLAGILLVVGFSAVLVRDDYQLDRIQAVFNGNSLEQDDNYQPIQARITLGSGGPFGRGLGQSRQKRGFLPEAHTDFIMAIIGEESGFAGTLTVLVLFGLLFTGLLRIARAAGSAFDAIAGSGLSAILICGVVIHALVNTGMVPVTGMPLPLISWGGTSMVVNLICIGTVAGMAGRASQ